MSAKDVSVLDEQEVKVEKVVSTAEVTTESATTTTVDELTLAQTLIEIKAAKPKVRGVMIQEPSEFTTTTTTTTPAASKPSQDKGKAKMIESEKPLKKKDQIMYDQEVALNLQAQLQAELEEEERLTRQKEEEANIALIESWDNTQAMMDADYQMAQQLQAEEQEQLSIEEKSKLFVQLLEARKKHFAEIRAREKRNKPPTQAQQRKLYCNYLKNMEGYTLKQLKGFKFEVIKDMFDKAFKRVNTFVDYKTELVEGSEKRAEDSTKRAGTELEQEVAKKQKIDDVKVDDDQEEVRMKELMNIVPDEEEVAIDAIPLATKPPCIIYSIGINTSELAEEQENQPSTAKAVKGMIVKDQNVKEEKDAEFVAMTEVAEEQSLKFPTVEQLLDEADKLNKFVQETPESPYDTESEIKVVKSFFTSHISELKYQTMHDSEETADIHEGSDSDLQSMPDDDDLRAVSGFHTADSGDTHKNEVSKSDHIFQDDNASTEHLSLPDHICEKVSSLHLKLRDMESSILPSFLSYARKDTLPQLLKDSIKSFVSKSISEELPHFNAFNKLESQRFALLQKELSKSLYKNMKKSIRLKEEQPSAQVVLNKEKSMVVHNLEEKKSEGIVSIEDDSDDDDLDKHPLSKRFKILTLIPNPIPLNTFVPKHLLKPEEQQKSLHDVTDQLFGTTSSKFLPTPPREPTPPKDPAKGKEVAILKEQVNELITYQEEGGSIPKMPKLKSFVTLEGTLSQEEFNNQIKESAKR
ncbi:hypothetical protein Tco_0189726 [Tanacetum coccineum]